jgi:hypothetical protein
VRVAAAARAQVDHVGERLLDVERCGHAMSSTIANGEIARKTNSGNFPGGKFPR